MVLSQVFDVRVAIAVVSGALGWLGCTGSIEPVQGGPTGGTSTRGAAGGATPDGNTVAVGGGEKGGSGGATSGGQGAAGAQPSAGGSAGQAGSGEPDGSSTDGGPTNEASIDARHDDPDTRTLPLPDAALRDAAVGDASLGDGGWVGPVVAPECAGDPTEGWTEYADTFRLEYPYDLKPTDRYTFIDGIYTYWIFPTDKPHLVGNTTAPRIETHWTTFTTGNKMWTGDILVDSPSNSVTIFQIHTGASGGGPVYLQVRSGNLDELGGQRVATGIYDKWFNLKVAFEAATSSATIWVNNCQKLVLQNSRPGDRNFYFKNGVYTCTTPMCMDHYKNIHLYQR